jgi:hypothetical protein
MDIAAGVFQVDSRNIEIPGVRVLASAAPC